MRILVLLYIQKACNKMPPNHGFYCCWAPNRYEQKVHFVCSPHMAARLDWRWTGGGREVHGRWTGGAREWAKLEHQFATVLGTGENRLSTNRR